MQHGITYVGLDAHKKEHVTAVFLPGESEPTRSTVANSRQEIDRWVRRLQKRVPGEIVIAYEAGVCGFSLKRQIERPGVRCIVAAPSLIPICPGQRVKTDRRDAAKLARLACTGDLTEVQAPDEQQQAARDLCRLREAAMCDLKRVRHQILKFLLCYGLHFREGSNWTQKHLAWLKSLRLEPATAQEVLTDYLSELEHRASRLKALDGRLEVLAQDERYREKVGWLRCCQGIDTLTAISILVELFGFERFLGPSALMSYLGLTPSEYSSGESIRRGGITKAGNRRVRRLLVEAAWSQSRRPIASSRLKARRKDQPSWAVKLAERAQRRLYQRYWRLSSRGLPPNKVVTAVARELAGFVWAMLQGPPRPEVMGTADGYGSNAASRHPPVRPLRGIAEAAPVEPARRRHPAAGGAPTPKERQREPAAPAEPRIKG
jgi:transposase